MRRVSSRGWLAAALVVSCAVPAAYEGASHASDTSSGSAPATPAPDAKPPAQAVLFIASELRGYLAPCGCSENMRGGIARAAYQIDEARRSGVPVLFIDAGNSLFDRTKLPDAMRPQEERKARALAQSFRAMGLSVRGSGKLDQAAGDAFLESLGLPTLPEGRFRLLDAGGRAVGVVSAVTPEELLAGAKAARKGGAVFVVGLLQQPMPAAQRAATDPDQEADLIVIADSGGETAAEENKLTRGQVPVVQVQSKGRSLVRVDLTFGGNADFALARTQFDLERELYALTGRMEILKKQIADPRMTPQAREMRQGKLNELVERQHGLETAPPPVAEGENTFAVRFIALESALPDLPAVKQVLTAYDKDVGLLNLAWAKKHGEDCQKPKKDEAGFVGSAACKECHQEAFPVWEQSKHGHAYETLVKGQKQFHLDCVGCHVTGYQQPGGVCRVDKVEKRDHVGCESCHGPGSLHVADGTDENIIAKPTEKECLGCHNAENSPHFNFAIYVPQILGKGHGGKSPAAK